MSETKVMSCTCQHECQDQKYGKQKRVHNLMAKKIGTKEQYRCTVCEKPEQNNNKEKANEPRN